MSSGKIVTSGITHIMQQPPKYEIDLIKENTDKNGVISCIRCEEGELKDCKKPVLVSIGFTTPKSYKLQTYFCNNCEYYHIDDDDTRNIRKFLSK